MSGGRVRLGLLKKDRVWVKGWLFDRRPFNDVLLSTQLTHGLLFFYFATYRTPLLIHNELDPVIYRRRTDVALLLLFSFLFLIQTWELEAKKLFSFATRWKRKQSDAMDFLYDVHRPLGRPTFFFWTTHGVTLVVMATVKTCWRFRPTTPSLAWPQNNATLEVMGLPGR